MSFFFLFSYAVLVGVENIIGKYFLIMIVN